MNLKLKILNQNIPLAEKLRPKTLDEVLGQEHLTGNNGTIRKMLENDTLNSLIFWGPPGTGKTTLAEIISEKSGRKFYKLSAVSSGVKDVRDVIEEAKKQNLFSGKSPILFIDEIHRFNKSQQDSLLHAVEKGWIVSVSYTHLDVYKRQGDITAQDLSKESMVATDVIENISEVFKELRY